MDKGAHKFERRPADKRCAVCGGARNTKAHGVAKSAVATERPGAATATMFSVSQTRKRLATLAAAARADHGMGRSEGRVEVGLRNHHMHALHLGDGVVMYHENDDLDENITLDEASLDEPVRTHGYFVHLYVYRVDLKWGDIELEGIGMGWMGTPDAEPVYIG
jgi:hypothetical protein